MQLSRGGRLAVSGHSGQIHSRKVDILLWAGLNPTSLASK
jgi:hypothetical protein